MDEHRGALSTDEPRPEWLDIEAWPHSIREVHCNGVPVRFSDTGTGPTLLFVHVGMWSIVWRDVIARLQDRYRCVALDAPGCGLSGAPLSKIDLRSAADAIDAVVRELDLVDITLVVHDLGGPAGLEAASRWPERVAGLIVVNAFGWRPAGPMFRGMLAIIGNPAMREFDAATGWLPRASATRLGVGRHWNRATRKTYRRGLGRPQRRSFHRYMRAARRHDYARIEDAARNLADRPVLTIFGQRNDPLRFQPRWKTRFPAATQITVAKGYHFPMCDNPELVAGAIDRWHRTNILLNRSDP